MKTPLIVATLIAVLAPAAAHAAATACPTAPRDQWLSDTVLTEKAKGLGYDVRSITAEDGCLEAYAIDKDGKRVEVYLDPATGDVVRVKAND